MQEFDVLENDREQLSLRRKTAAARRDREAERNLLLRKLIRTGRQAELLRSWITDYERLGSAKASPELGRMLRWARGQLAALEGFLDPLELSRLLRTRNLFPEADDLVDPLGDPPPQRPWGR
jgi:hypothetical protein